VETILKVYSKTETKNTAEPENHKLNRENKNKNKRLRLKRRLVQRLGSWRKEAEGRRNRRSGDGQAGCLEMKEQGTFRRTARWATGCPMMKKQSPHCQTTWRTVRHVAMNEQGPLWWTTCRPIGRRSIPRLDPPQEQMEEHPAPRSSREHGVAPRVGTNASSMDQDRG